jgi:hypothetical protein
MTELYLTPEELAARLRKTTGTLPNRQVQGIGPKFIKSRPVLYPLREVENGSAKCWRTRLRGPRRGKK